MFEEQRSGEIARFSTMTNASMVAKQNYYTFEFLKDAPDYSIPGVPYLGVNPISFYEAAPWDVMRQNGIVYDYVNNVARLISSVTNYVKIGQGTNYFLVDGLIMPGSIKDDGTRVTDYSAWFLFDTMQFRYSEILSV